MEHSDKSWTAWLDAFRWIAAFLVMLAHGGGRLLADHPGTLPALQKLLYLGFLFMTGFSHHAVMVFFVLSGYLVGGSAINEYRSKGDIDLLTYFTKRLVRLWLVLLPVLLIGAAIDHFGMYSMQGLDAGIYRRDWADMLGAGAMLCNAAFLQTVECQTYGSNGSLWSLMNEFWYYVLFPLGLLAVLPSRRSIAFRIGAAAVVLVIAGWISFRQFDGWPLIPYMLIWLMGVFAVLKNKPLLGSSPWVALATFVAGMVAVRVGIRNETVDAYPLLGYAMDVGISLLFANLIIAIRVAPHALKLPAPKVHMWIASISFSLYCVHVPLIQVFIATMSRYGIPSFKMVPLPLYTWLIVATAFTLPVIAAIGIASVTEWRTDWIRRWISGRLRPAAAPGLAPSG